MQTIKFSKDVTSYFKAEDLEMLVKRLPKLNLLLPIDVEFMSSIALGGETNTVRDLFGNLRVRASISKMYKFDYSFLLNILYHEVFHAVEMSSFKCVMLTAQDDKSMVILDDDKVINVSDISKYQKNQKYHDSFDFEKRAITFASQYVPFELTLKRKFKHLIELIKGMYNEARSPSFNFQLSQPVGYKGIEEVKTIKRMLEQTT